MEFTLAYRISHKTPLIEVISSGFFGSTSLNGVRKLNSQQQNRIRSLLKEFYLDEFSESNFGNLSDGLKRRALIARALANDPEILILDEPVSNLDLKSRHSLILLLEKISSSNTTIVQVTHNIDSILKNTERVILIKNKKIIRDGNTSECLTSKELSYLFDTELKVIKRNGYWQVFPN